MQELIRLALSYLTGVWRYRWMIVIVPALVSPVGWFYVATLPDVYAASAKVFVDTDSVLKPLMSGIAVRIDDNRRIRMMTKLLFSREIMEKLARMTDQDLRAKTPEDMERLTNDLKGRVRLAGQGGNIYELKFNDESADLAKRVVQSFLTIFVETNLGESRKDQDSAEQFLLRELKDYERRMVDAERKLKNFKSRNLSYLRRGGNFFDSMEATKTKLEQYRLDLEMSRQRRDELQEQLLDFEASGMGAMESEEGEVVNPLQERIDEMNLRIDELSLRYTDRHPEIITLRRTVKRLEDELAAAEAEATADTDEQLDLSDPEQRFANNPIYQQLKLLVSEGEAEVASREAIVEEYERRISVLEKEVDRVLEVETEQKQLNRDYSVVASKHKDLLSRLESLRLGREVDTSADTVRFRVIEPPKVSSKPVGPNRILLSSTVFAAGLVVGIGIAFVISLLRPTFMDRKLLASSTGITVLGSVDMIWTDEQRSRRRWFNLAFAASFLGLLIIFALVLAVYQLDIDVLSRLPVF